jgi:Ni/Fe-hydrogenase subunit HybB-like protein
VSHLALMTTYAALVGVFFALLWRRGRREQVRLFLQIFLGTLVPLTLLGITQVRRLSIAVRQRMYVLGAALTMVGIFAMRWNVVIGGQLFSKSFLGYTTYKMGFATREGLLPALIVMALPVLILWALVKLFPPMAEEGAAPGHAPHL